MFLETFKYYFCDILVMPKKMTSDFKSSIFEIIILLVGVGLTYFGFKIVSTLYSIDGHISWAMMSTIFSWLMLLVLFILLSMGVDASRRQLEETKLLKEIIKDEIAETKLLKEEIKIMRGSKAKKARRR